MARFRARVRSRVRRRRFGLVLAVVAAVLGYELYRVVVPFHTLNPLWHEATVGETVIQQWRYGGVDEEGYLKFYNQGQTVLLPPEERVFDADGQFVVLEGHTPNSVTYAQPYAAVPASWLAACLAVLSVPAGLLWLRWRRWRRRLHTRRPRKSAPVQRNWSRRARAFRPARRR
ncbi:MAG: hypothetical protein K6T31_09295 [Alicyclobacillus sp.]|nr:hypothetical protein [Alicyclobacillus sp.]